MQVLSSAKKHGVSDADILHPWEHAIRLVEYEYDDEERLFVIGPYERGALLELIAVPADAPGRIIHADRLRPKYFDLLR